MGKRAATKEFYIQSLKPSAGTSTPGNRSCTDLKNKKPMLWAEKSLKNFLVSKNT